MNGKLRCRILAVCLAAILGGGAPIRGLAMEARSFDLGWEAAFSRMFPRLRADGAAKEESPTALGVSLRFGAAMVPAGEIVTDPPTMTYGDRLDAVRPAGSYVYQGTELEVPGDFYWREGLEDWIPGVADQFAACLFRPRGSHAPIQEGLARIRVEPRELTADRRRPRFAYNGEEGPTRTEPIRLDGILPGETLELEASSTFSTVNAGEAIPVTTSLRWREGRANPNYRLPEPWDAEAEIAPCPGQVEPVRLEVSVHPASDAGRVHRLEEFAGGFPLIAGGKELPEWVWDHPDVERIPRTYLGITPPENRGIIESLEVDGNVLRYRAGDRVAPNMPPEAWTVAFRTPNFAEAVTVEVVFRVEREAVTVTPGTLDKEYDGLPVEPEILLRGMEDAPLPESWKTRYIALDHTDDRPAGEPPRDAGRYRLEVYRENGNGEDVLYPAEASDLAEVTIRPRPLTLRPVAAPEAVPIGGEPSLRVEPEGLLEGDTLESLGIRAEARCEAQDTLTAGEYRLTIAGDVTARNYRVTLEEGTLVVYLPEPEKDGALSAFPEADPQTWRREPFSLRPAAAGYDLICREKDGTYSPVITVDEEFPSEGVAVYLKSSRTGTIAGPYWFPYRMDRTPPVLEKFDYVQVRDRLSGYLEIRVTDAATGPAELTVRDPDGKAVEPVQAGYPAAKSGVYTAVATDRAGNQASVSREIEIRTVEAVAITKADGSPLEGIPINPTALGAAVEGTALEEDYTLSWASGAPELVSVDAFGALTFHGLGTAEITVRAMGKQDTRKVESALVIPVNQAPFGGYGVEIPRDSIPHGTDEADLRLLIGLVESQQVPALEQRAKAEPRLRGMELLPLDIRLLDAATGRLVQPAGEIAITLPFGEDYDEFSRYAVLHLHDGRAAVLECEPVGGGIRFVTSALSPFVVGYRPVEVGSPPEVVQHVQPSPAPGSSSARPSEDEDDGEAFWEAVTKRILDASGGDVIHIDPGDYREVPGSVLRAARGRPVTLRFAGDFGDVILYGQTMLPVEADRRYAADDLRRLAAASGEPNAEEAVTGEADMLSASGRASGSLAGWEPPAPPTEQAETSPAERSREPAATEPPSSWWSAGDSGYSEDATFPFFRETPLHYVPASGDGLESAPFFAKLPGLLALLAAAGAAWWSWRSWKLRRRKRRRHRW